MDHLTQYKVGFVILHYGDIAVTDACLKSIMDMEGWRQTLIVIVDNEVKKSSADRESTGRHFETEENITVLRNAGQGGFSEANNLGYQYARSQGCQFILVLNNDITFTQRDFLPRMQTAYEAKECHVMAPDVVRASTGEHQNPMDTRIRTEKEAVYTIKMNHAALSLFPLAYPYLCHWEQKQEEQKTGGQRTGTDLEHGNSDRNTVDVACTVSMEDIVPFGACLIFTPAFVREQEKGFEPETLFFYEEYILALRCRRLGYLIRYTPSLKVLHESGAATKSAYRTNKAQTRFRLERTRDAAKVYLDYLRSGK